MMSFITKSVVRNILRSKLVFSEVSKRGIRAVRRQPRTELPKYKINIARLPHLTRLLTHPDGINNEDDAIRLRIDKLYVYKQYLPVGSNTNLIEALFSPQNDIDKLLKIIDENLKTMNSFYIAVSFEVLDDMIRGHLCDPATIMVSPEFKNLCQKAVSKVRFFEADEVLKLIKCLSSLEVPENTLLVQASFNMTRHLINDFTIDELEALANSLDTFKPLEDGNKSLLNALKSVIPAARKKLFEEKQTSSIESHLLDPQTS